MLIVISPAKNLDYETETPTKKNTKPQYLDKSAQLIDLMQSMAPHDISTLMGISDKLGTLNFDRFQAWSLPFTSSNARQAIFAFNGDVYTGLEAYGFDQSDLSFAQEHLRILSGLYGLLRPLDLMQPYRLEMGVKLVNSVGKDLYSFWDTTITEGLNKQLKKIKSEVVLNLASNEYFRSVKPKLLGAEVITPEFKDWKNDQFKMISFFAKKARGRMSAYIIKNKIDDVHNIKAFDWDGYAYSDALSSDKKWVFTRKQ